MSEPVFDGFLRRRTPKEREDYLTIKLAEKSFELTEANKTIEDLKKGYGKNEKYQYNRILWGLREKALEANQELQKSNKEQAQRIRELEEWTPVSEPPKIDGLYSVLFDTDEGLLVHCAWFVGGCWSAETDFTPKFTSLYEPPIKWKPLPTPPKAKEEEV